MPTDPLLNTRLLIALTIGILLLALANALNYLMGMPFWPVTQAIYLGADDNMPAWYSSALFIIAALLAGQCYMIARSQNLKGAWGFLAVSALLLLMSCDEIARFHETVGGMLANKAGLADKSFAKHTGWVWVAGPLVILLFGMTLFALRPILKVVPRATFLAILGFLSIILGGIVLESTTNFLNHDDLQWVWNAEIIVEESLEMIGTMIIAFAFLLWRDSVVIGSN